ncbi:MFGE8 [Branchiostoma lanceolatum]|uniref:MFGE8 protein n=1 Tax=Branchiostoma lanceolatum TaxID=7740 RepID=A0A8K0ES38_BRALA|nr:MFGE8 [Branchiostoma lanceolatum]
MQLILCTFLWSWQAAALLAGHDATPLSTAQDLLKTELRNFRLDLAKSEKMLLGRLPVPLQRPRRSVDITASNMYHPFSFPTEAGSHRDTVVEDVVVAQTFNLPGLTDLEFLDYSGHQFITMVTGDGKAEVYLLNTTTGHFSWTSELDISGGGGTAPNRFLGVSTGEIPNTRIKASSRKSRFHKAHQARLHLQETTRTAGAWVAGNNNRRQWLQVDLGQVTQVSGIITQGRNSNLRNQDGSHLEYVKLFKVQYSNDGTTFKTYKDNSGNDVEFPGNSDRDTTQVNMFVQDGPITAQYIRVVPVRWKNNIAMRIELLGQKESVKQLRYFSAASNCLADGDPAVRQYCAVLSDYTLRIYEVIMPFFFLLQTPVQTLHFSYQARGLHLFHTPQQGPTDPLYLLVLPEGAAMVPTVDGQLTVPTYRWQGDTHSQCSFQHMSSNPVVPETGQDVESFLINSEMYMVIAHHSDSQGEVSSESTVLKYNPRSAAFQHLQSLHVRGAVDVEYFRIGQDPYLALAAHSGTADAASARQGEMQSSYIFKWNGNGSSVCLAYGYLFEVLQTISVDGSQKFESILVPSSEKTKLLALVHHATNHSRHTSIYQYSNQHRQFELVQQQLPVGLGYPEDAPADIVSFVHHGKSYLAVAHTNWTMLYRLEVSDQWLPSTTEVEKQKVLDSISELKQNISELSSSIQVLAARVAEEPVTKMGDQIITGTKTFTGNVTIRHLVAKNITVGTTVVDAPERSIYRERLVSMETIKAEVGAQQATIESIMGRLQDAVAIDTTQKVPNQLELQDDVVLKGDLSARKVTVKRINGLDIPQLQQEIVKLDEEAEIMGSLAIYGDVLIMGDLNVNGTYSGVDLSLDAMTVATPQNITGLLTFSNDVLVNGDVELTGTLNGVDLSEDVVTLSRNHSITGNKTFLDDLYLRGDIVLAEGSTVDEVDIVQLSKNVLTIQGDQIITGAKTVRGDLTLHSDLTITGTLNDIDISDMDERVIKLDEPADVTGHKTFVDDVEVNGGIELSGHLNDVDLWEDLVILRDDPDCSFPFDYLNKTYSSCTMDDGQQLWCSLAPVLEEGQDRWKYCAGVMTGYKTFSGNVTVLGDMYVTGTVDDTYLPEDVVTLTGSHNISGGIKTFSSGMTVMRDVTVAGLVDGVDLTELQENVVTLTTDQVITGPFTFQSGVNITENMHVSGEVDGVDLSDLAEDVIYVNYPDVQEVEGQKIFSEDVDVIEELTVTGIVNSFNLEEDFLHSTDNQTITGHKTFIAPVTIYGDLAVKGTVDGVNLTELLQDMATLSGDQVIRGHKTFSSITFAEKNLIMDGTLNGIDLSEDAVLLNDSQTITGTKVFKNGMVVEGALAVEGSLHVEQQVNGVNLNDLAHNRVTLWTDQVILGRKTFCDQIIVEGDAVVKGTVNGLHLQEFVEDMMLSSTPQTVTGRKVFLGQMTVEGDVITNGTVDGVDMSELMEEVIYLDKEQNITGNKLFSDPVVVQGDLFVEELVDGVNITQLGQDMVYSTGAPQVITGTTTFLDGFHVEGDIHVLYMVQGMDISEELWTVSDDQVITGQYVFQCNVTFHQDLEIQETVNGLDLSEDVQQWMTLDDPQDIFGNFTFESTVFVTDNLDVTGTINGVDLSKCLGDAVIVAGDQVISGTKHFLGQLTIHGDLFVENVNEVNWPDFVADIVTIHGDEEITGTKTFLGEVVMNSTATVHGNMWGGGQVDGVDLTLMQEEAIYLDEQQQVTGAQVITGEKTFLDGIKVNGNIQLTGMLDGVNLTEAEADSLKTIHYQTRELQDQIQQQCEDIGTLHNTAEGAMEAIDYFVRAQSFPLFAARSFHSFDMEGKTWLTAANLRDDSGFCASSPLYTWDVGTSQFVQTGSKLTNGARAWHYFNITEGDHTRHFLVIANQALQSCPGGLSADVSQLFEYNPTIRIFTLYQSLTTHGARDFVSFRLGTDTYLAVANSDDVGSGGRSAIFKFNQEDQLFQQHWSISTPEAVSVDAFEHNGTQFLVYANSKLLGDLQTQVFVYDDEQSQFQALQTIPTSSASDVVHFVLAGLPHLVVADMYEVGLSGINNYKMHIKVYRWSQDRSEFVWTQTMHFEAASDVAVFYRKNDVYLAAVSLNTAVTVYRHKGVSGFLPVVTIPAHGARSVQPVSIGSQLFLAVAQDPLDTRGQDSTLFKAVMTGATVETVGSMQCDTSFVNDIVGQLPDQD